MSADICQRAALRRGVRLGNTEEEIEEHDELTRDEKRASLKRAPRLKYEPTASSKKQSSKSKQSAAKDQPATGKPDL